MAEAAAIESSSVHNSYLPLDDITLAFCEAEPLGEALEVLEFENAIIERVEEAVTLRRLNGLVVLEYEAGYRIMLVVLDGVVFGACARDSNGGILVGDKVIEVLQGLGGPATLRTYRLSFETT